MSKTVSATFKTAVAVRQAILELEAAGFTEKQLSIVAADNSIGQSFNVERESKAAEGGAIGGVTGGVIGAIAAGLAAVGSVVIPGVNLVVYGTLVAAAAGAGVGAAAGGLAGSLIGLGIPEFVAKRYEDEIKDGAILVVVEAEDSDEAKKAKDIFERGDAHNVSG
ncbi:hypothetical protein [Kordiimonas sp.]|uniref:hypothetical protein n=1 Tax=Kordiimonas sp. TaxID=1970157 RepID=UPI003A91C350